MQDYLSSRKLKHDDKTLLLKLRTEMTNVKANFSKMYENITCDLCDSDVPQTDSHLLECSLMIEKCSELENDIETEYEDLFGDIESQMRATHIFKALFEAKEKLTENN